jgi:DNA-binding NarL/FixJ family response regulator
MRRALAELIDVQRDFSVCAATATAEDAILALDEVQPDAAVVDVSLPGMSGIDLTRLLHARWPTLPVVVISSFPAARFEQPALDAGAHAYLVKRETAGHLIQVLRRGLDRARHARFAPDDRPGPDRR